MSTEITDTIGPNYFTDFTGGQGGGATNYFTYAQDLDTTFVTLKSTINQLVAESRAVTGPLAATVLELMQTVSADDGIIGQHSYAGTITGGSSEFITIQAGSIIINNLALSKSTVDVLAGSGGAGDLFVAVTSNGNVVLNASAGLDALDIFVGDWDGAAFVSLVRSTSPGYLVFPDGDDIQDVLDYTIIAAGTTLPTQQYERLVDFFENIVRVMSGLTSNVVSGGGALLPMGFAGTEDLPGLVPSDGTTPDVDSGWYREGLNAFAGSVGGTKAIGFDSAGNTDLPTNSRVGTTQNVFSLADAAYTDIVFGTEEFDVGGWHSGSSALHTVPAGGDGIYVIMGHALFSETTTAGTDNLGDRGVRVTVGGSATDRGTMLIASVAAVSDNDVTVADIISLSAGNVVRLQAFQDSGGAMDIDAELRIVKIA